MPKTQTKQPSCFAKGAVLTILFGIAGMLSFILGFHSVGNIHPVDSSVAQQAQKTEISVILQYMPLTGDKPIPIEVTPFMNSSQTALLQLFEIHDGRVYPSSPTDRCRQTSSMGRCSIRNVPVGKDIDAGVFVDRQYDIIVDTHFLEFITRIPFESSEASVRFDTGQCGGGATVFTGDTWCLTRPGGNFSNEYFVTITLKERNACRDILPPAPYCSLNGSIVNFICNQSFTGPTSPWQPKESACTTVQCPDGNNAQGICTQVSAGISSCSSASACMNNQLCAVTNFGSDVSYDAGKDILTIRGVRFGAAGGTVSFPTQDSGREVVQVFPGPDWTDKQIRVRVPMNAVSGILKIHPNTHGSIQKDGQSVSVTCDSVPASIRAYIDQFAILSVTGTLPQGIQLVAPGFETKFTVVARHNDRVGRFESLVVELVQGAFPDPNDLPLNRTLITQQKCPINLQGSNKSKEAVIICSVLTPQSASAFNGPFTFIVTLYDDKGESVKAVLLDAGSSVLMGDLNEDGILTIHDAAIALRIVNGAEAEKESYKVRDTDGDRRITMNDVLYILHSLTR